MPRVSVIVPTHNRAASLPDHIERLMNQTYGDYDAVYVNDRSNDETGAVLEDAKTRYCGRLHVITTDFGAPGPSRNAGAAAATGDVLLFTDDDVRVPHDWIERMLERFAMHACEALCGGIRPLSMTNAIERYLHHRVQHALGHGNRRIDAAPMMNFMIARRAFNAIGGFSKAPLRAAEDWEFCRRLTDSGARIFYDPAVSVEHEYQREWGPALRRIRESGAAGVRIWRMHHSGAFAYTMYSLLRCVLSPFWTPFQYPADLYPLAVYMEYRFAEARLIEYLFPAVRGQTD